MTIERKLYSCHIMARLFLSPTSDGGRATAIKRKYTPLFCIDDECIYCAVILQDRDKLLPGEESTVKIDILGPQRIIETIRASQKFDLKEGPRIVGKGEILEKGKIESPP